MYHDSTYLKVPHEQAFEWCPQYGFSSSVFLQYIYTNQTSEFLCNVSLLKTRYQSQSQKSWRKQWRPAFLFERKTLKDIIILQLVLILQFDFRQSFRFFFPASYIVMPVGGCNGFVQSLFMRLFCESFNDSLKRCVTKTLIPSGRTQLETCNCSAVVSFLDLF